MTELTVSSKGQIVLPAAVRRRLGLGPGAKVELVEATDGVTLRPVRTIARAEVAALAGMVTAPPQGRPRRLADFDAAAVLDRRGGKRP